MDNSSLNCIGNSAGWLINVSHVVSFVYNHQFPINLLYVSLFGSSEVKRTNDDLVPDERVQVALFNLLVERSCFQNHGRKKKFVSKLLIPLFANA